MTIEKYAVCDTPEDWGDANLYDDYQEAKSEAIKQDACVVALTWEYDDSELVDDFRKS